MNEKTRNALALLGFALIAVAGFVGARYWQAAQMSYVRTQPPPDCDLRAAPCRQSVAGGWLEFSITPSTIPLMETLRLDVEIQGLVAEEVVVEIRGLNMNMGLNRTLLTPAAQGRWTGETILPLCSQRSMEWEAAVRLRADARYELPFLFQTKRP